MTPVPKHLLALRYPKFASTVHLYSSTTARLWYNVSCDAGGYHLVTIGDVFKNGRYVVLRKLGWGHFSTVWLVHDRLYDSLAALKVQKSATHYTEAARDEIKLLTEIHDGDVNDEFCCCRILDDFEHAGPHGRHVCMVFEVLGENLLALVKKFNYQGIPLPVVRNLARQILIGLDYLHRYEPRLSKALQNVSMILFNSSYVYRFDAQVQDCFDIKASFIEVSYLNSRHP